MGGATRHVRDLWCALRRELREARVAVLILALGLLLTAVLTGYVARWVAGAERDRLDREAVATEVAVADRLARHIRAERERTEATTA
jgi:CHASE1-domain containing sensor protein